VVAIVSRQTEISPVGGFLRSVREVLLGAKELLDTELHVHVPFWSHGGIGIRCCVVLCAERNNGWVDGFFTDKDGGFLEP
jgi:hypothetical protein